MASLPHVFSAFGSGQWPRRFDKFDVVLGILAVLGSAAAFQWLEIRLALLAVAFLIAVLAVARSDIRTYTIPDGYSGAIAALGLVNGAFNRWPPEGNWIEPLLTALISGALASGVFWTIAHLHRKMRGFDGLGFGDVKLAGACAIWLSLGEQAATLEVAALTGIAVLLIEARRRGLPRPDPSCAVPFGALLAPAAWVVHFLGAISSLDG